jgi:hypothetical protein
LWSPNQTSTAETAQSVIPEAVSAFGVTRVRARPLIQRDASRRVPSV